MSHKYFIETSISGSAVGQTFLHFQWNLHTSAIALGHHQKGSQSALLGNMKVSQLGKRFITFGYSRLLLVPIN